MAKIIPKAKVSKAKQTKAGAPNPSLSKDLASWDI